MRYTMLEKDLFTYRFIQGGKELYEFDRANTPSPHIRTVQRYLSKSAECSTEGKLMIRELKEYLERNRYPLAICWSEDATRITGGIEYNLNEDKLSGLVAPIGTNGMPIMNLFKCSSPRKVLADIQDNPIGRNVQLCMAQPICMDAAPFCILYYCTNNKFSTSDVLNKWNFVQAEMDKEDIKVVCIATDGDSRFIGAMLKKMKLPNHTDNPFSAWFVSNTNNDSLCVQDPTHLANKFRTRLVNQTKQLILGRLQVSKIHLEELVRDVSKDQHGLAEGDLSDKDKMKFRPVEKITSEQVMSSLDQHIPLSNGTVAYLKNISCIISSYMDPSLSPAQRIFNVWKALFLIRCWRNWCISKHNNIQNCITTNAYWGLEINAHTLINFVVLCRTKNLEFTITLLQSQTCEGIFRDARSLFTSTESTIVNFTMQGFEARLNKIQTKRDIMARQRHNLAFPRLKATSIFPRKEVLPGDIEISAVVEQAKQAALEIALELGFDFDDISFEESIVLRQPKPKPTLECGNFEFVTIPEELITDGKDDIYESAELFSNIGETLNLKDSSNFKHVFRIRNRKNKIVHVKKRTFIWMLTSGLQKCSTDRLYRFRDSGLEAAAINGVRDSNAVYTDITVGVFVLLKIKKRFAVCKVYGFKYLKGKNCSCSLSTMPVKVPEGARSRGVELLGSFFDIVPCDEDYNLDLISNTKTENIECYVSHLMKPSIYSSILHYAGVTVSYIQNLN
ncbi:uncharacterized protein LOC131694212 [Topomyia yanbarensis]|uniref:uncharacterized protein LOC131694212 n=1 Tax=Topomyia yanbarensis TaxID=2498891 RepID=UPI00273B0F02|nr:uncharacterized protein LOC131694212 [Topomyia yanbarensis]